MENRVNKEKLMFFIQTMVKNDYCASEIHEHIETAWGGNVIN